MTLRRFTLIAVLAALVSSTAASQGQAGGGTAITTCGTVVTQNAFLTKNLHCVGQAGVVVGASGITIDLRGFTLRGDRSSDDGIDDTGGYNKVTIKNGVVRNFDEGVTASADRISVSSMLASGLVGLGIYVTNYATAPVGTNIARGNDQPAQCDPASLC